MTAFNKFEKTMYFLAQAAEARRLAQTVQGKPFEPIWLQLAESWEFLAQLQSTPCFCGRPSIGYKLFANGEKRSACSEHMTELIVESTLRKLGVRNPI